MADLSRDTETGETRDDGGTDTTDSFVFEGTGMTADDGAADDLELDGALFGSREPEPNDPDPGTADELAVVEGDDAGITFVGGFGTASYQYASEHTYDI